MLLVPYVPTPYSVVVKMLEIAGVGPDDVLYDLGCGDGRIPIVAVREFGVSRAYCVEIRSDLIETAKRNARQQGVYDKIVFINDDLFKVSVKDATVITLFLLTSVNDRLAPKLEDELDDYARVISHEFKISQWREVLYATIHDDKVSHDIYFYIKKYSTQY